jgi:hypothetical protein
MRRRNYILSFVLIIVIFIVGCQSQKIIETPICGNGNIESSEICDEGTNNGLPNHCDISCSGLTVSICGNQVIELGEECDGNNNCDHDCRIIREQKKRQCFYYFLREDGDSWGADGGVDTCYCNDGVVECTDLMKKSEENLINNKSTSPNEENPINALTFFSLENWENEGKVEQITLKLNEIYSVSNRLSFRVESITNAGIQLSLWSKDSSGCKLVEDFIFLKNIEGREKYFPVLDWLLELNNINGDIAKLSIYSGSQAYKLCSSNYDPYQFCLSLPQNDWLKVELDYFSRYFSDPNQYNYNNLKLNYLEKGLEKIETIFPSLKKSKPLENTWRFITYNSGTYSADLAYLDTTASKLFSDGTVMEMINNPYLYHQYEDKFKEDDLNFDFDTDLHEWTHLIFFSTELNQFCHVGSSCKLVEGIADYIQYKIKLSPEQSKERYLMCGDYGFKEDNSVLGGMSYKDAFENGYVYDAGSCFFNKVEEVCGINSLDLTFDQLFDHSYHPFEEHFGIFKLIRDNCNQPNQFDEIIQNFGFPLRLLDKSYPLTNEDLVRSRGCPN